MNTPYLVSSVTPEFAQEQLSRLSGLDGYRTSAGAQRSLIEAMRAFRDQHRLQAFVTSWLRNETYCPKPKDLYADQPERPHHHTGGYHCYACYDTGQTSAEFLVTWTKGKRTSVRLMLEQSVALWAKHAEGEQEAQRLDHERKTAEARQVRERRTLQLGTQMIYETTAPCHCQIGA